MPLSDPQLPLALKIAYTAFLAVMIPIYWVRNGPTNFLWFSDIALIVTATALWLEQRLLASAMAVSVLVLELAWMASLLGRTVFDGDAIGIADYMTDPATPGSVKLLSGIFHIALPVTLVWMVAVLGYDRRALALQTLIAWIVLPATYLLSDPEKNINWVFRPGPRLESGLPPLAWLGTLMLALPALVYWPTHWVLLRLFGR
jgi:hypothetical protein